MAMARGEWGVRLVVCLSVYFADDGLCGIFCCCVWRNSASRRLKKKQRGDGEEELDAHSVLGLRRPH